MTNPTRRLVRRLRALVQRDTLNRDVADEMRTHTHRAKVRSDFLRGGGDFGATTLSRFYAIHMMLVPGLIAALIGAHLYLVTRLGTTAPPWIRADVDEKLREEQV